MNIVIGIDPGLSGALAAVDAESGALVALDDLPIIRDGRLAWIDAQALLPRLLEFADRPITAVVERQLPMPKQGVASTFTTGVAFGALLAALQAAGVPIELVAAAVWKRALGLVKCDKKASLYKARLLFPGASLDRQKDHGRAEALLLAWWRLNRSGSGARNGGRVAIASL